MARPLKLNLRPDTATLRSFGFIAVVGFTLLALAAYTESGMFYVGLGGLRIPVAGTLAGLGALAGLFSLVAPHANRPLYVGLSVLAYPIGFVVSHVALAAFYFGIITPLALLFRLAHRDELALRPRRHRRAREEQPASESSYWVAAKKPPRPERYFRQF